MDWETWWCFYNSSAFKGAAGVALLGVFGVILPALIKLPSKRRTPLGSPHTPILDFNDARRHTKVLGSITLVASLAPVILYFIVLGAMEGKTCEIDVTITRTIRILLLLLYAATGIVLVLFGWFFLVWQRTLKLNSGLSGND